MKKIKKNQKSDNNLWSCNCGKELGEFLADNVIKIKGPQGQEYEIGFNYIEVTCSDCKKACRLESRDLKNIQDNLERLKKNKELSKLAIDSGEIELRSNAVRPLGERGLKSFYALEDRYKKILKTKLTEWQNKIYDCLCSMGLEADISDEEDWDKITQAIAKKLKISPLKVEHDIPKIQKIISVILKSS